MSKVILFTHPIKEHITDMSRKYGWCANNEDLKTFKESIKPYNKNNPVIMPWNDTAHDRKFIECKCDVLDGNNKRVVDKQRFWGEWEQPSQVFQINGNAKGLEANYVHIPLFGRWVNNNINNYRNLQNTDPYVFGNSFYYCCCKQNKYKYLRELDQNDIIIFCGLLGTGVNKRFAVDTIFVVGEKICDYGTLNKQGNVNMLNNHCPEYVYGVINPVLYCGLKVTSDYVLYKAKMYNGMSNSAEMFSYFPVKDEENYQMAEVPFSEMERILDVKRTGRKIGNRQQASLHDKVNPTEVWYELKKYIAGKGYSMGIKAYDDFDYFLIDKGLVIKKP